MSWHVLNKNSFLWLCHSYVGVDFGEGRRKVPPRVWQWKGQNMSGPLGSLASNAHFATKNPKFQIKIEPQCGEDPPLFLSSPEFGGKILDWNRIIIKFNQTLQKHIAPMEFA